MTDRHHPPEWLESDELPAAWVAEEAEAARQKEALRSIAPEEGYKDGDF